MTVQRCTQTLLIEVVTNETDAATKNEETIQSADFDVFVSFLWCEGTTVSQKVDEADGNTTIDVQNKLGEHSNGIDKQVRK